MSTVYPSSIDSFTDPTGSSNLNDAAVVHHTQHAGANDAINAIETYLGTNASQTTPTANHAVLNSTSATAATWATTPTLVDAVITTPSTNTTGHVATVDGTQTLTNKTITAPTIANKTSTGTDNGTETLVNKTLTSPTINTPTFSAGAIPTAAIANGAVTAPLLSTSAILLGYTQITGNFTTTSATAVQVTGLTSTVTVPAGGRGVKITVFIFALSNATANQLMNVEIWDGVVGSGTLLNQANVVGGSTTVNSFVTVMAFVTPAAGSKTYNVSLLTPGGTAQINAGATSPAFILVELI